MASVNQNREFARAVFSGYPLDDSIDWIANNMEPEEVFSQEQLERWAKSHGFVEREDQ